MTANFLWSTGIGPQGLITSTGLSLITTEINSIANGSFAVSGVSFLSSDTGNAMWGYVNWKFPDPSGSSATGPVAGGVLAGYFMKSLDGGVTYPSTAILPGCNPDFIFAFSTATIAPGAGPYDGFGPILLPPVPFKVCLLNQLGNTMGSGANAAGRLTLGCVAPSY